MSKYYSDKQFWKQAEEDVEEMGEAIDLLKRANEEMLEAIDLLNDDEYGELDPMPVVDFGPELDALEKNRQHFVDYVSEWRGIHTLVESVDEQFMKAVSKAYEAMSMLDIRNYKVKNTLGATEVIETYVDSKKGTYLQPEKERVYETRIKSEINIDDILYLSNIDGYRAQYDAYAAEQITGKDLNPKEIETMKRQYYTMAVGTSFEHEAYADEFLKGLSTTLDFIPVIGGAKQILEGLAGVTLTGDRLTSEQAWQRGLFGVLSLGIDIVTLGSGSMAVQAGKFVSQTASRVVVGWTMKTATEFMVSNGWNPGLVFMSNMVGGYLGNKAMNSVMNGTWFHNFSVTRDMKSLQRQNPELFDKVGKLLGTDARGTIEVAKGLGPKGYRKFLKDLPNVDDFLGQASVGIGIVKGNDVLIKQLGLKNQLELDSILNYSEMNADELAQALGKGDIIDILYGNNIDFSALDEIAYIVAKDAGFKPSNSPSIDNWTKKGGTIEINADRNVWKYTDIDGNVVFYRDGFPDFYNYKHSDVLPVTIQIAQPKNNGLDFRNANKAAGLGQDSIPQVTNMSKPPLGYTWHHMENGKTMILVNEKIHTKFKHLGGQSVVNGKGGN